MSTRLHMDARITPNRSLSGRGLVLLMCVLGAYNLLVMGFLLLIGAFPVPVFLGLDFVGLAIAFRISNRRSRRGERVQVSAAQVRVLRGADGNEQIVWASPTAFTRVSVEAAEAHEARVRVRLSGRSLEVGAGLSPGERADFGAALQRAIASARAERHPA